MDMFLGEFSAQQSRASLVYAYPCYNWKDLLNIRTG
jgi:hypothetical protein